MSTTYFSFTFATAEPALFAPFPRWWFGQDPTLIAALSEASMTASRGDWLHFVLGRIRDRLGGKALDFLFGDRHSRPEESEGSAFLLTAIEPAALPAAIALAEDWCTAIADRPEILATACERDVDYVREQLASPLDPLEFERLSEDGDEPAYLVDFLQHLAGVLRHAEAAGNTVIHALVA
jgi:hypothetical protein